jgi:hypothetical protein
VSVPGYVGFREKGESIMESRQLSGLVSLGKSGLLRVFDDTLPDLSAKRLVGISGDS